MVLIGTRNEVISSSGKAPFPTDQNWKSGRYLIMLYQIIFSGRDEFIVRSGREADGDSEEIFLILFN